LVSALALLAGVSAASSLAAIYPASAVVGPANDILAVDGAAMARDGSGGVLYSEQLEGVTHLFAVPFANGRWGTPAEVDREDAYGASEGAIAAGGGGRLLVVWVQPRNISSDGATLYELMSASLQAGSDTFGQAIVVDPNVGEPYTGDVSAVDPRLAMAPDGSAYVVYRVITDDCSGLDAANPEQGECPPSGGGELVQVRVARFEYLLWSSMGAVNRAPQLAMPAPTPANAPAIGIALNGDGVVAWQEPAEVGGPARIWVRRLFGGTQGTVLQGSPETLDGQPVSANAEAPELAVSPFGETKLSFQIDGAPGSSLPAGQLFLNSMLAETAPTASQLKGATPVPSATADDLGSSTGAIDRSGDFRVAWSQDGQVRQLTGSEEATGAPVAIGSGAGPVFTTINPAGGGTTVWQTQTGGRPLVQAREDYADGAYQSAQLAGGVLGPISGLAVGGSGEGDALIAWMQGPPGSSEVVGDFVQVPPAPFLVSIPKGWITARAANVTWEPSTDAVGGVTYSVYVDGHPFKTDLTVTHSSLSSAVLGNGVHQVQVLAIDSSGQRTMSVRTPLEIDIDPPSVKIKLIDGRRGVRVSVRDDASGVQASATKLSFGDGRHVNGHAIVSHVYPRAGLYTIVAQVRDEVGNHATVQLRVRVR
jgi:hypothetical protein